MENYLKSIVVRFRAISPAQRRLVFAGCLLAVVFLLFFTAANRAVRPGQHTSPLSPNGGSLTGQVLPPDGVRSTGGDAKEVGALAPLRMLNERYSAAPVTNPGRSSAQDSPRISSQSRFSRHFFRPTKLRPRSFPAGCDRVRSVRRAVEKLDSIDREILLLREFEQLSYAEIANLLQLPLNTVRSRLFRALPALRNLLEPPVATSTKDAPQHIARKGERA